MVRKALMILGYVAATAVVVIGTILLVAYGKGYSYDFGKQRLIHRGLVLIDSTPSGAQVMLGNKQLSQKTPYRQSFEAGTYGFTLTKDNFRTWTRRLTVVPSQVSFAQYVILIATKLTPESIGSYPAISNVVNSTDHKKTAFTVPSGPDTGVWVLDTASHRQTRIYASAAANETQPAEVNQVLQWSDDNSRLLIKRQIGATSAYLVLNANNASETPVNLTETYKVADGSLQFDPSNARQLYWLNPDGLRRLNLADQTASAILADHVGGFTFTGDRIAYVVNDGVKPPSLWSLDGGGHKQQLATKLPVSSSYNLSYATYLGTSKLAVAAADSHAITLYSNLYNRPTSQLLPGTATQVVFSEEGRFLLELDDHRAASYDLEHNTTSVIGEGESTPQQISWFDPYHLVWNRDGQTYLSEFDGNYANVMSKTTGLAPVGTADTKAVITTTPSSSGSINFQFIKIRQ